MLEQWKIHKDKNEAARPCCKRAAQSDYFAVLELPACVRRDLCATCFSRLERESDEPPIYWRARRRPSSTRGPVLDLASLRVLFDTLGERDDDQARGLRYFVALLLVRKRILKILDGEGAGPDGADLVVIDPKREDPEPMGLFAPPLDDDRLAGLKDELLAALDEPGER